MEKIISYKYSTLMTNFILLVYMSWNMPVGYSCRTMISIAMLS